MTYIETVRRHQYRIERYIHIITWARKRYTKGDYLEIEIRGMPSPYTRIEKMAWDKYFPD